MRSLIGSSITTMSAGRPVTPAPMPTLKDAALVAGELPLARGAVVGGDAQAQIGGGGDGVADGPAVAVGQALAVGGADDPQVGVLLQRPDDEVLGDRVDLPSCGGIVMKSRPSGVFSVSTRAASMASSAGVCIVRGSRWAARARGWATVAYGPRGAASCSRRSTQVTLIAHLPVGRRT